MSGSLRREMAIGATARVTGLPVWLLRELDSRGIVMPQRSAGGHRLYSGQHIETLRRIASLINDRGVNLAGVEVILEMEADVSKQQEV